MFKRKSLLGAMTALAVMACWLSSARAQDAKVCSLLPEGTVALVKVTNYPQFVTRWKTRSTYKMYKDPEMQRFLENALSRIRGMRTQVEAEVGVTLDEIEQMMTGPVAVALLTFDPDSEAMEVVVIADVKGKESAAKDVLARLRERAEKEDVDFKEETIEGSDVIRIVPPGSQEPGAGVGDDAEGQEVVEEEIIELGEEEEKMFSSPMAFYYTLAKNYLVIDIGTEAAKHAGLDAVLAAVAGKDIRSLATNPNFADAMKSLSSHSQGVMNKIGEPADACSTASADAALYLNIQPFMQMLYKQTEEGIVRAEDVVSALGFAELKSICATMHMREKYNLSQAMVYMPGDKSGLAKLLAKPLAETTPPSFVPANVVSYGAVSFDMSDFFKQLLSLVEQINPGIHAQVVGQLQMLAANEAEPFDIEKELFGSMGSQVQIFVTPTAEKEEEETDVIAMNPMQQIQPMVIVIDTRDKNTLRGGLDKMFRLARGLVSVTPRMVRGTKVYEVRMGAGGLDATDPILSYAFIDNSICFATRPELMDGVIQGAAEPKDPLAKSADYKEGCKVLPDTLCSVQFKNSAANIEQTVKQLKGQGGAMAANPLMGPLSGLGELLDMDTLPSINTLKKYLTYTIGGTQPTGDGWFSVGYTPEP